MRISFKVCSSCRTLLRTFIHTVRICLSSGNCFYENAIYLSSGARFQHVFLLPTQTQIKESKQKKKQSWKLLHSTLRNLFYNTSFRLGRSKCRSRPGTGCTLHTWGRLRAIPGPGRLSGCTGRVSDFHSPHTSRIPTSLREEWNALMQHCARSFNPPWHPR